MIERANNDQNYWTPPEEVTAIGRIQFPWKGKHGLQQADILD